MQASSFSMTRLIAWFWYLWGLSWRQWGLAFMERDFFRRAVTAFDRALMRWPEFDQVRLQRGILLGRELQQADAGIADLSYLIERDPAWAEPYLQRGLLRRYNHQATAALYDFQQFLMLDPSSSWREEVERQIASIQTEE